MTDLLMLLFTGCFFLTSLGLLKICERLMEV